MPSTTPPDGRPRRGARAAVALAVLAVLVASLPATAIAGSEASGAAAPTPGTVGDRATCAQVARSPGTVAESDAGFRPPSPNESADLRVARGDLAVVPLSVPAGANVTVGVGSGDGYTARLGVRDDGDGRVRLVVNTYLAGNRTSVAPGTYRAAGDDTATVLGGTPNATLIPGTYPVTARRNGTAVAERELTVTEPSFESVTARRGVPRLFEAANASAIRTANGTNLTAPLLPGEHDPEVVEGETLLIRIDAPSLLGAIAAKPGNTTTERFLTLTRAVEPDTAETFDIMGPCGGILFADTVAEGGARVLADHREGAVYVLLDTANLEGLDAGGQSVFVEVHPESRLAEADGERELRTDFRIAGRQTEIPPNASEVVPLSADDGATVAGETNLLPGSTVTVRVESRTDPSFERRTTATVAENGTFSAALDLSNASAPGLFAVHVGPHQFPAEVGDPPGVHWELRQRDTSGPVTEFSLDRLDFPLGTGFLVAYRYDAENDRFRPVGSATATDDELAVEPLSEPQHLLVVAHRDADADGLFDGLAADPPYRVNGEPVRDWVNVTVGGVAPDAAGPPAAFDASRVERTQTTRETTVRETTTADPTTATPPTDSTAGTASTTPSDAPLAELPGFGPVAAALAVVVLALLVAVGRRSERR